MNNQELINQLKAIRHQCTDSPTSMRISALMNQLDASPVVEAPYTRGVATEREDYLENAELNNLYTHWAHHHLLAIHKMIKKLSRFSNFHLGNTIAALHYERDELILGSVFYRDAAVRIMMKVPPGDYLGPEPEQGE